MTSSHKVNLWARIRFKAFANFPSALWTLTARWNPVYYLQAIDTFLSLDETQLDCGYTLELQRGALQMRYHHLHISYLTRPEIQKEIEDILTKASSTSLDAEKAHQLAKRCVIREVPGPIKRMTFAISAWGGGQAPLSLPICRRQVVCNSAWSCKLR